MDEELAFKAQSSQKHYRNLKEHALTHIVAIREKKGYRVKTARLILSAGAAPVKELNMLLHNGEPFRIVEVRGTMRLLTAGRYLGLGRT